MTELENGKIIFFLEKIIIVRNKKKLQNKFFKITTCEAKVQLRNGEPVFTKRVTELIEGDKNVPVAFDEEREIPYDIARGQTNLCVTITGQKGSSGGPKTLAIFHIEVKDVQVDCPARAETRSSKGESEAVAEVRLVFSAHRERSNATEMGQLRSGTSEHPREAKKVTNKNWQEKSASPILGTFKVGKTATIHLCTGNEDRGNPRADVITWYDHKTPSSICYPFCYLFHKKHPRWMDMPGFEEYRERAQNDDNEIKRDVLKSLRRENVRCLEAIVKVHKRSKAGVEIARNCRKGFAVCYTCQSIIGSVIRW